MDKKSNRDKKLKMEDLGLGLIEYPNRNRKEKRIKMVQMVVKKKKNWM